MPEGFDQLVLNWRSALTGSVMVSACLTALFLLRRRAEPRASAALAAFVVLACVSAVPTVIGFAGAYDIWPDLTFLPTETYLLLAPLIAIHARALMVKGMDPRLRWLLAPGVIHWLYQLWAFTMLGSAEDKWAYGRAVHAPYVFPVVTLFTWVMIVACTIYVWRLRRRYLAWLDDNHADSEQFDASWLSHLLLLAIVTSLYWVVKSAISIWYQFDFFEAYMWDLAALFLVFVIALEALGGIGQRYPKMSFGKSDTDGSPDQAPSRDWVAEGARLQAQVCQKQWFLEPDLSLQSLSRRFGMNHVYLSRSINEGLGCNFNGFINRLRVDHAKALIEAGDERSLTDIALAVGFGSKASFNRAFKSHSSISPSEFRKRHLSK